MESLHDLNYHNPPAETFEALEASGMDEYELEVFKHMISGPVVARTLEVMNDAYAALYSHAVTQEQKSAVSHAHEEALWAYTASPGDRLPGVYVYRPGTAENSFYVDISNSIDRKMFYQARFEILSAEEQSFLKDLLAPGTKIREALDEHPLMQYLYSFDGATQSAGERPLNPSERTAREAQIQESIQRKYGLDSRDQIAVDPRARAAYNRDSYALDDCRVPERTTSRSAAAGAQKDEAAGGVERYIDMVRQHIRKSVENDHDDDYSYVPGISDTINDEGFAKYKNVDGDLEDVYVQEDLFHAIHDLKETFKTNSSVLDEFAYYIAEATHRYYVDHPPLPGTSIREAIRERLDSYASNHISMIDFDASVLTWEFELDSCGIVESLEILGLHTKICPYGTKSLFVQAMRPWADIERPNPRTQQVRHSPITIEQEPRTGNIASAQDLAAQKQIAVATGDDIRGRLVGSSIAIQPMELGTQPYDVRIDSSGSYTRINSIAGYDLVGFETDDDSSTAYFKRSEDDPYDACDVTFELFSLRRARIWLDSIGATSLSDALRNRSQLTVTDMVNAIRDTSDYALPETSNIPACTFTEDEQPRVINGRLQMQCNEASNLLVKLLRHSFSDNSTSYAGGSVVRGTQGEQTISDMGHAQTLFVYGGRKYLLDATPYLAGDSDSEAGSYGKRDQSRQRLRVRERMSQLLSKHKNAFEPAKDKDSSAGTEIYQPPQKMVEKAPPNAPDIIRAQTITRLIKILNVNSYAELAKTLPKPQRADFSDREPLPQYDPVRRTLDLLHTNTSNDDPVRLQRYIENYPSLFNARGEAKNSRLVAYMPQVLSILSTAAGDLQKYQDYAAGILEDTSADREPTLTASL